MRLGAMLGDEGCALAEALLRLADETHTDLGCTFSGASIYLKTRGNGLTSAIEDTCVIDGGHFDFMMDQAAEVVRIVSGFSSDHV